MRLRELYAKGLASCPQTIALPLAASPTVAQLEPDAIEALGRGLDALLYPEEVDAAGLAAIAEPAGFECGLIFRIGEHDLRLRRGLEDATLELQMVDPRSGGFVTRATGVGPVSQALATRLGRPARDTFLWLQLGGGPRPRLQLHGTGNLPAAVDSFAEWLEPTNLALDVQRRREDGGDGGEGGGPDESAPRLPNPFDFVAPEVATPRSSREIERLRTEYRRAQRAEALEDRINELRRRLADLTPRTSLSKDHVLESLRQEMSGTPPMEVSDEDLALLRAPDARLQDFERRKAALQRGLEEARQRLREGGALWKRPVFVAGVALTVVCTAISIVGGPTLRAVALGNVAWLAGALAGLLHYLQARDDGRDHRQRVYALEEGLADLDEERHAFDRHLAAVRRKHGVQSAEELEALRLKRRELADAETRDREARRAQHEEALAASADVRGELDAQLARLQAERDALGECPLASFQIAQELRNLGLDPDRDDGAGAAETASPAGIADSGGVTAFGTPVGPAESMGSWVRREAPTPPLYELADSLGLLEGSGLEAGGRRLWGRMLAALLNRAVSPPDLAPDNTVQLSADTGLVWATLTARERALVVESGCLALLLRAMGRPGARPWPWILRLDPYATLREVEVARLLRLYERVAEHLQIIVFDSGRREEVTL